MPIIHEDHNGVSVDVVDPGHYYEIDAGFGPIVEELTTIKFQTGPVKENGVNGVTNEALLAILIDRLDHLQGKFPCNENEVALSHINKALDALEARTADRLSRGVEGTNQE